MYDSKATVPATVALAPVYSLATALVNCTLKHVYSGLSSNSFSSFSSSSSVYSTRAIATVYVSVAVFRLFSFEVTLGSASASSSGSNDVDSSLVDS